jgi:hypothetical protein
METKTVEIEVRSVYGNTLIYPANEAAQIFAKIAGKKTLDKSDLNLIRALGFEVEQVFQKLAA